MELHEERGTMTEERKHSAIIPAQPGFYVVEPVSVAGGPVSELTLMPVLAWLVQATILDSNDVFTKATPLALESIGLYWAIRQPDGRTVIPMEMVFEPNSDADVIAYFEEKRAHRLSSAETAD